MTRHIATAYERARQARARAASRVAGGIAAVVDQRANDIAAALEIPDAGPFGPGGDDWTPIFEAGWVLEGQSTAGRIETETACISWGFTVRGDAMDLNLMLMPYRRVDNAATNPDRDRLEHGPSLLEGMTLTLTDRTGKQHTAVIGEDGRAGFPGMPRSVPRFAGIGGTARIVTEAADRRLARRGTRGAGASEPGARSVT